jgi:release factor glutamine methyltransferase
MTAPTPASETVWTVARLLAWTTEHLTRRGLGEARLASEVLLAHAAGCRRIDLYARFNDTIPPEKTAVFRELIRRAAEHEPIAYLVGEREFFSLPLAVGRGVLIPRPETETLVECVLDHLKRAENAAPTLLDVGTGSGCIAIALLKHLPGARATATDVSAAALATATANAARHGLSDRVTVLEADGLALPEGAAPEGGYDVIVSNPPYIAKEAMPGLADTVKNHEPHEALTDGADGLSFYRRLAEGAAALLAEAGVVAVEIGADQAPAVRQIFEAAGWTHAATRQDRVTGRERVLIWKR